MITTDQCLSLQSIDGLIDTERAASCLYLFPNLNLHNFDQVNTR
jgi:hypothetical protein